MLQQLMNKNDSGDAGENTKELKSEIDELKQKLATARKGNSLLLNTECLISVSRDYLRNLICMTYVKCYMWPF